ncbi:MAG: gliding motility lipoprotein GldH [Prevotella sp.]|jgi:gliding motility-associated lipoprotein GldH
MRIISALTLGLVFTLTACKGNKVYDHFEHASLSGWEKTDTLRYNVPKINEGGRYCMELGMRLTKAYPYQSLTLIIERKVLPSRQTKSDTIECKIVSPEGRVLGRGITLNQYHFHVAEFSLKESDSLHVSITHNMKREILPGISDVGIEISKLP